MLANLKSLEELGIMAGEMLAKRRENRIKEFVITAIAESLLAASTNVTSQMSYPMSCSTPSFPTGKKSLLTELEKLLAQQSSNSNIVLALYPLNSLPDNEEEDLPWYDEQPEELK